jgi:LmbE family N-acetylglucosaminyl deacetylase
MLRFLFDTPQDRPLRVLAVGSHPDDIEIGAGGTLMQLAGSHSSLEVSYVVLTGTPERHREAHNAAAAFFPTTNVSIELHELPEGRLPAYWDDVKTILENVAQHVSPDAVFAPGGQDAHQDHRTVAEIVPTVFRDVVYLSYEIPKWDGDMWRPAIYVPLSVETTHRKVDLLNNCFPSQGYRHWWDKDVFVGLARLRGMECRATYAEAFGCAKAVISIA